MNCTAYALQLEPVYEGKQPMGVEHPVVHFRGTRKLCRADQKRPVPTSKSRCVADREVKHAIAQLAAAERRLLSIHDELFGRAWQLGKLLPAIKDRVGHGKWNDLATGWQLWQTLQTRIAKSSISERRFAFQKTIVLRGENAILAVDREFTTGE
jgi:hypothetical protein